MQRIGMLLALLVVGVSPIFAQSGGQFCVRSFQDDNQNGILEPSEPLLTRGVSVDLLDASNVIINSRLLETSPNSAQGIVCFQNLPDGEYTVMMNSADYVPTTQGMVTANIQGSSLPTVVEFGARAFTSDTPASAAASTLSPEAQQALILRLAFSSLGAIIIMVGMAFVGFIVYWTRMRNRQPAAVTYSPASVQAYDPYAQYSPPPTGTQPVVPPPVSDEDTGKVRPVDDDTNS